MALLPEDYIEAVRQAVDAVDVVGRHVTLRRQGGSYKGLCPFHREKSPSFVVWPETKIWKCFGCGKSGNVFGFITEREGLTFPEAVLQLGRELGLDPPSETQGDPRIAGRRERLYAACEWACRYFEAALRGPDGARARDYFRGRAITGETALRFRLGYAPPGWDGLLNAAQRGGFSVEEICDAGLAVHREDGGRERTYDRFRDRVVFPIADARGRVIAFGARTLGDDEPKYLNSNETPLFQKGQHLYALHLARQPMHDQREGAVMEGYTDVVLAHQHGYECAVAGLGTALGARQAALLARHVRTPGRVFLLYDGDLAGRRAAERATAAFLGHDVDTRVVTLPAGEDPADVVVRGGLAALRERLDTSEDAFSFLVRARIVAHSPAGEGDGGNGDRNGSAAARSAAATDVLDVLAGIEDPVRAALHCRTLATELGVPEHIVQERLAELRRSRRSDARPDGRRVVHGPAAASGASARQGGFDGRGETAPSGAVEHDGAAAVGHGTGPDGGADAAPRRPPSVTERQVLEAALAEPAFLAGLTADDVLLVAHPVARELLARLLVCRDADDDPQALVGRLADPALAGLGAALLDRAQGKDDLLRQGRDCLRRLSERREARGLHDALRRAEHPEDEGQSLRDLVEFHRRRAGPGEA